MMDLLTILLGYPAVAASSIATFIAISRARALHLELRSVQSAQVPQIVVSSPDSESSAVCCNQAENKKQCCAKRNKKIRVLIVITLFLSIVGLDLWFLWTSTQEAVSAFYDFLVRFSINMAAITFTIHLLGLFPDVAIVLPPLGSPLMSKAKNYKFFACKNGSYMIEPTNVKLKIAVMMVICLFSSFGYNYVQDSGVPTDPEWMKLEKEQQPVFYWLVKGYDWIRSNESLKQGYWLWIKVSVVYTMGLMKFGKKASLKKVFAHMLGFEAFTLLTAYLLSSHPAPFSYISSGEITSILPEPKSDPAQWMNSSHWEYMSSVMFGFVAILVRVAARYDFVKSTKFGEVALPHDEGVRFGKDEKDLPVAIQNMGSLSTELPRFKIPYMFSIPAFKPFYSAILLFVAAVVPEVLRCVIKHSELPEDDRAILDGSLWGYLVMFVQVPVMFVTLLVVSFLRGEMDVWSWEERWRWDSEEKELRNECH